jgi:UDP-3-O-[3-hydroxymyristoyl] N-acetylglucosamine deacetylase
MNIYQNTVNRPISFSGVGLHSGKISNVKLLPASEDSGIIFKRVDLENNNLILSNYKNVSSATLCTTLKNDHNVVVSTVEHLLAAFYIIGIDNITVEIDNEEVPIMDGSSKNFLSILDKAGIKKLNKKKKYINILKKFEFEDNKRKISIEPNFSFEVDFELDYKNKIIGKQKNMINFLKDDLEEIIESRTFCLYEDIEKIKKIGLAKGGSLDNAVVVNDEKVLNKEGLRNKKEFVNHKILDLAGDFLLSGYNILGKVRCVKGGHQLSNLFLKELLDKNKENFEIIELEDVSLKELPQKNYNTRLVANG